MFCQKKTKKLWKTKFFWDLYVGGGLSGQTTKEKNISAFLTTQPWLAKLIDSLLSPEAYTTLIDLTQRYFYDRHGHTSEELKKKGTPSIFEWTPKESWLKSAGRFYAA